MPYFFMAMIIGITVFLIISLTRRKAAHTRTPPDSKQSNSKAGSKQPVQHEDKRND
ncbi:hypothetical protein [Domibacillus indicus]|uniref:hypothetical protein n=1 Tax=Domibacillus indicus TaxID=1437523 RepID=UPI000AC7C275|nr:hypothetical protein [Domibacillus indicus]